MVNGVVHIHCKIMPGVAFEPDGGNEAASHSTATPWSSITSGEALRLEDGGELRWSWRRAGCWEKARIGASAGQPAPVLSVFRSGERGQQVRRRASIPRGDRGHRGTNSGEERGTARGASRGPNRKPMPDMVGPAGFEPATPRLKVRCARHVDTIGGQDKHPPPLLCLVRRSSDRILRLCLNEMVLQSGEHELSAENQGR